MTALAVYTIGFTGAWQYRGTIQGEPFEPIPVLLRERSAELLGEGEHDVLAQFAAHPGEDPQYIRRYRIVIDTPVPFVTVEGL